MSREIGLAEQQSAESDRSLGYLFWNMMFVDLSFLVQVHERFVAPQKRDVSLLPASRYVEVFANLMSLQQDWTQGLVYKASQEIAGKSILPLSEVLRRNLPIETISVVSEAVNLAEQIAKIGTEAPIRYHETLNRVIRAEGFPKMAGIVLDLPYQPARPSFPSLVPAA